MTSGDINPVDELFFESARQNTFKNWPFGPDAKCNPKSMAEAGFYANTKDGEFDSAVCFLCGKELDGWDSTDDPWLEHKQHAPQCMFVQLNKPESDITVQELYGLCHQYSINHLQKEYNNMKIRFTNEVELIKLKIKKGKM